MKKTSGSEAIIASFATRRSTRAPRIGPSGAASPSAARSERRSGRSQTNSLSFTRHWVLPRETTSVASGMARARRRTSSQGATVSGHLPELDRVAVRVRDDHGADTAGEGLGRAGGDALRGQRLEARVQVVDEQREQAGAGAPAIAHHVDPAVGA